VLVTISGLPGSGTSTVAQEVARRLGLEYVDGGTIFRRLATERGLSLSAFAELAERDETIDTDLDEGLAERARAGNVVLESRLAGWIATNEGLDALRVWIACDPDVRARRAAERDGLAIDASRAANRAREASERLRYLQYYDIDLADLSVYDLVLDSTDEPAEALVEAIASAL
jgi:CMP/dCMP kinase